MLYFFSKYIVSAAPFVSGVSDVLTTVLEVAKMFIAAPLFVQFYMLFLAVINFIIVAFIAWVIFIFFAYLYAYIYSLYLPMFGSLLTKRMRSTGYSEDQIESALRGKKVGRPVYRDKSKDEQGSVLTEDEKIFEELAKLDADIAKLYDPNSEEYKLCEIQGKQIDEFLRNNPEYLDDPDNYQEKIKR